MAYFARCEKCKNEIAMEDFRFELPYDNGWICFECLSELDDVIKEWTKK
jgi:hypothetical protein